MSQLQRSPSSPERWMRGLSALSASSSETPKPMS